MGLRAGRVDEADRRELVRVSLYLRSRRAGSALAVMCVLGVGNILVGGRAINVLSSGDPVSMPYRYVLVMLSAVTAVASTASPMIRSDRADTGPLHAMRWAHLVVSLGVLLALAMVAESFADGGSPLAAARAAFFWFGAALISMGVARASLAWVLPIALLVPLIRWGYPGGEPAAWNWAQASAAEPVAWGIAAACFALGLAMTAVRE